MLTTGITPGNDMRFKTERLESARNFANKLWNASRFVIMNLKDENGNLRPMAEPSLTEQCSDSLTECAGRQAALCGSALRAEDKWMIARVNDAVKYVNDALEKYDLELCIRDRLRMKKSKQKCGLKSSRELEIPKIILRLPQMEKITSGRICTIGLQRLQKKRDFLSLRQNSER